MERKERKVSGDEGRQEKVHGSIKKVINPKGLKKNKMKLR